MRILITGHPGSGKSTLANHILQSCEQSGIVVQTDEMFNSKLAYSPTINKHVRDDILAMTIDQLGPWQILEGTLVPWGLRRWLNVYADGEKKPFDLFFWVKSPSHRDLSPGALGLCKSIDKVMWEVINHPKWTPNWKPLDVQSWSW